MSVTESSSTALRASVEDFLFAEAEVLDRGDYTTWVRDYITEDITYKVPVQVTRERKVRSDYHGMYHIDDVWATLDLRARRLETEYAWAEDPPSRVRHMVSNVRVRLLADTPGEAEVKSHLLLFRNRSDKVDYDLLSAERRDTLRQVDGAWRLARRVVLLDQSVIGTHNLMNLF
jgi:3-phenylpropionate/cinnamic acid dioxygenase small subunit